MDYCFLWFYRLEGIMEVHFDRETMKTEGKRGRK